MKNVLTILSILFFIVVSTLGVNANTLPPGFISGPSPVNAGETHTYSFTRGSLVLEPRWVVTSHGVIENTWQTGTTYYASIHWYTTGTATITFYEDWDIFLANKTITVSTPPPPATPNTSFTTTQNCNATVVTRNTEPPSSDDWYWQTISTGTSTALGNGSTISITTDGPLYLRARLKVSPYTWSSTSQSVGTIQVVAPPAAPLASTDGHVISDIAVGVPLSVSPVAGASSYKWYQQSTGGTPISGVLTTSYSPTLSQNQTYYVEAVIGNCPSSTRKSVTAYVHPQPIITTTAGSVNMGSSAILEVLNYNYNTYQWINSATGTDISGATSSSFTTTQPGEYKVRVSKSTSAQATTPQSFHVGTGLDGLNMNFVIANTILVEGIAYENELITLDVNSNNQNIQYFDGLGRSIQTVSTQGSPAKKDIVQPVVYDEFSREHRKYLPLVPNTTSGWYKSNIIDTVGDYAGIGSNFYANNASSKVAQDSKPYSETIFETSPLSRPVKSYSPGQTWSATGSNKFVEQKYLINVHGTTSSATAEKVIAWKVDATTGMPARYTAVTGYVETDGYFSTGQMFVNATVDEQGNAVREYKNKQGQVILKKVQATSAGSNNLNDLIGTTPGWALTYYLYDDLGNLRYVFPPELSKLLHTNAANYVITTTDLANWAFQYKYDGRKRIIEKQVPGAGAVYMVYDNRDRLVMTQDANQRATSSKYWSFTKYDELNRPILTGIKDTVSLTQSQMQAVVDNFYAAIPTKPWRKWGELYVGNITGNLHGYSNKSYPIVTGPTTTIDKDRYLSVTYYDNYLFRDLWVGTYTYQDENLSEPANGNTYNQPDTEFTRVIGQVTGTKIKVLDGGVAGGYTWLKSVNYYDDRYRVIQSLSDNYKGGTDRVTNVYDFVGKVLKSKSTHIETDVTWKDRVGVSLIGNKLVRTAASNNWTGSGAISSQQLAAGQNGWLEVTVSETNMNRMIGLADTNPDLNYTSIDYAFYLNTTSLKIYENGALKSTVSGTLLPGDVVRMERTGTTMKYYKSNTLVYTSATASSTLLFADVSINSTGSTLTNVRTSFSTTSHTTTRRFEYDHAGRLLKTWHKLDTQPEILLTKNEYNELGQLVDKKLHSTVASAADAKQSVDYRYNIRGWLTKLNESDLNINEGGDPRDFFGMELLYEQPDAGLANTQLYNGNISAMKWSNQLSLGTVKENAHTYGYDPLNRITASTFKEKATSWTAPANNVFAETGFTYDLNGNIKSLQRNDKRTSGWMDNLAYDYGTGSTQSNKLLKVTDTGDDFKGFVDGNPGTGTDYTYDANGNMITDLNKSISSAITYNFLNLPEKVTRNNGSVTYIYDASGRKLSQVASYATAQKQTDYAGEYVYENDALQFISHEEGRIMLQETKTIITADGSSLTPFTASANFTNSSQTINGETYIKVLPNVGITLSKLGTTPIGGNIPVTAGERYVFRVKGYSNSTKVANLYVKGNASDIVWFGANLPTSSTAEMWVENSFTIPAGVTQITLGVLYSVAGPSVSTDYFYINAVELVKLTTTTPEYQYNLKDHLGNNRLTFTTKEEIINETATLESANAALEQSQFVRYAEARKVQSFLFDKTNGSSPTTTNGYAQRLSATANEKYGLGKSISVMPGDVIYTEVYAKYVDPVTTNWNTALNTIMGYVLAPGTAPAGTIVDGASYTSSTASFPHTGSAIMNTANSNEPGPKAYLNWLVFDRDFNFILSESGYKRLSNAPKESGQDVAHELLYSPQITIKQAGYVYIYVSNEETSPLEVYFDDFKVTHTKSPVIQTDDYYPFGLTFNSYQRENSVQNKIKFQGQEHVDDLGLNWDSFKWRNHQPDIGRFFNIDPLAEKFYYNSPYAFSENRVIDGVELEGLEVVLLKDSKKNEPIIKAANNGSYADNAKTKTVHVFAHGNTSTIYNDKGKKGETSITTGAQLNKALNQSSSLWKDSESKEGFTVVIHSCRTGRTTTDENGNAVPSVAENISESPEMQGVNIVAPTERDFFSQSGTEMGPFEAQNTDPNTGDYLSGTPQDKHGIPTDNKGQWNTFQNGQMTKQSGDWKSSFWQGILDLLK